MKLDATGLRPGTTYYYRFESMGERSAVGRTRTLPAPGVSPIRLGVVSCSNLPFGYFNAYACLANREDLDAIVHLGDYSYEYQNGRYGDGTTLGRIPFIVTWDDHEFANNTWRGGAENHSAGEGDWLARRNAAQQAYYEWMPIREDAQTRQSRIYRIFRFGDMATLFMLDTRLVGRDQQPARDDIAAVEGADRQLLGAEQEGWLAEQMVASVRNQSRWNLFGQQVIFAPQAPAGLRAVNSDSWDGYRAARARVFDMLERATLDNLCVLTGDIHSSWAYDLPRRPFDGYDRATGKGSLGVEFAGTSVTSPTSLGAGPDGARQLADIRAGRPHLHYVDGSYRGYFIVDLTRERLQADFYGMATIEERSTSERFMKGLVTESGRNHLVEASSPA